MPARTLSAVTAALILSSVPGWAHNHLAGGGSSGGQAQVFVGDPSTHPLECRTRYCPVFRWCIPGPTRNTAQRMTSSIPVSLETSMSSSGSAARLPEVSFLRRLLVFQPLPRLSQEVFIPGLAPRSRFTSFSLMVHPRPPPAIPCQDPNWMVGVSWSSHIQISMTTVSSDRPQRMAASTTRSNGKIDRRGTSGRSDSESRGQRQCGCFIRSRSEQRRPWSGRRCGAVLGATPSHLLRRPVDRELAAVHAADRCHGDDPWWLRSRSRDASLDRAGN